MTAEWEANAQGGYYRELRDPVAEVTLRFFIEERGDWASGQGFVEAYWTDPRQRAFTRQDERIFRGWRALADAFAYLDSVLKREEDRLP